MASEQHISRLAGQPAPRPVGPQPTGGERPSYDEVLAQREAADFGAVLAHLSDAERVELGLPAAPAVPKVDHATAMKARTLLLNDPRRVRALPDEVRDLLGL
ncbi:hypothetical protein [Kitasatospora sp. NPDC088783]|uniref:hypothetical protein n=1 Tax=Kitasatospora sp. NPDC088783 TaxID=3364077 RepID=UPI00381FD420